MKTVKTFEEWMDRQTKTPYSIEIWNAGQANVPEKTCEWKWVKDLDSLSYEGDWMGACGYDDDRLGVDDEGELNFCGGCGGKVTIKPELTAEQKLEKMTVELTALKKKELMWGTATDELEEVTTYLAESDQKLEAMTIKCDDLFTAVAAEKVWRETAEKHIKNIIEYCNPCEECNYTDTDILQVVREYVCLEGLDK